MVSNISNFSVKAATMEKGIISYEGTSKELKANPEIIHRYLGVSL